MFQQNIVVDKGLPVIRPLTVIGDTTGTFNANGNYSITPQDFFYLVPTGNYLLISQVTVVISTSANLNQSEYGDIVGGLPNGLKFFVTLGGVEVQLLAAQVIKTNNDFYVLTFSVQKSSFSGVPQTLSAKFDLASDFGTPLVLQAGDKFIVRCNDNFTSLLTHKFVLRGILV